MSWCQVKKPHLKGPGKLRAPVFGDPHEAHSQPRLVFRNSPPFRRFCFVSHANGYLRYGVGMAASRAQAGGGQGRGIGLGVWVVEVQLAVDGVVFTS